MARAFGIYDQTLMELIHGFKYRGKMQLAEALGLKRWVFREEVYDGNKQYDGVDPWEIELNSGDGSGIVVAQVAGRKA